MSFNIERTPQEIEDGIARFFDYNAEVFRPKDRLFAEVMIEFFRSGTWEKISDAWDDMPQGEDYGVTVEVEQALYYDVSRIFGYNTNLVYVSYYRLRRRHLSSATRRKNTIERNKNRCLPLERLFNQILGPQR